MRAAHARPFSLYFHSEERMEQDILTCPGSCSGCTCKLLVCNKLVRWKDPGPPLDGTLTGLVSSTLRLLHLHFLQRTTCNQLAPSDLHASHAKLSHTESRHRKTEAIASSVCGKWIVGSFINPTCSCSDKSEDAGTSKVSRVQLGCFNSLAGAPRVAQQVTYRFARK